MSNRTDTPSLALQSARAGIPPHRTAAEHIAYLLRHAALSADACRHLDETRANGVTMVRVDWPEDSRVDLASYIEGAIFIALRGDSQRADVVYALGYSMSAAWIIIHPRNGEHRQGVRYNVPDAGAADATDAALRLYATLSFGEG